MNETKTKEGAFTKSTAWAWFAVAVADIELGGSGPARAFGHAWAEATRQDALERPWREWVQGVVKVCQHRAASPAGLLMSMLQDGSSADLSAVSPEVLRQEAREAAWEVARAEQSRLEKRYAGKGWLPLRALTEAHREGMDVHGLCRAWDEAGRPAAEDFAWPGWQQILSRVLR